MTTDAAAGRWFHSDFSSAAGSREYHLWLPPQRESQPPSALLVFLHGCRQKPDNLALISGMNAVAGEHGALVLYPQQRRRANVLRCWNWFDPHNQVRGGPEPGLLAALTNQIVTSFRIDPSRVYVAGISAGGAMSVVLAVTYPEVFRALGVVAGVQYRAAESASAGWSMMHHAGPDPVTQGHLAFREMQAGLALVPRSRFPMIAFYGDRDRTVAPANGEQLVQQWAATNVALASAAGRDPALRVNTQEGAAPHGHSYTQRTFLDSSGSLLMEEWRVHGLEHAWPGSPVREHYADPLGPEASREIWRFFQDAAAD